MKDIPTPDGAPLTIVLNDQGKKGAAKEVRDRLPEVANRMDRNGQVLVLDLLPSALAFIGVYSYSIYLWHLAVKLWAVPVLIRWLGWHTTGIGALVVYVLASLLVGVVMARLIEVPTLALRERWVPSTATGGQQPAASEQHAEPVAA